MSPRPLSPQQGMSRLMQKEACPATVASLPVLQPVYCTLCHLGASAGGPARLSPLQLAPKAACSRPSQGREGTGQISTDSMSRHIQVQLRPLQCKHIQVSTSFCRRSSTGSCSLHGVCLSAAQTPVVQEQQRLLFSRCSSGPCGVDKFRSSNGLSSKKVQVQLRPLQCRLVSGLRCSHDQEHFDDVAHNTYRRYCFS